MQMLKTTKWKGRKMTQGFTLKYGIKETLVGALQKSFENPYWTSLNAPVAQILPKTMVLAEYPAENTEDYPFIRVQVQQKNAQYLTFAPASEEKIKAIRGTGSCTLDYYALYPTWRDILTDDLILLLLLRGSTLNNDFDKYLAQAAENGNPLIYPNYGSVTLGSDDDGEGLPWAPDLHIYASTLTFEFAYIQTFEGQLDGVKIEAIKQKWDMSQNNN